MYCVDYKQCFYKFSFFALTAHKFLFDSASTLSAGSTEKAKCCWCQRYFLGHHEASNSKVSLEGNDDIKCLFVGYRLSTTAHTSDLLFKYIKNF